MITTRQLIIGATLVLVTTAAVLICLSIRFNRQSSDSDEERELSNRLANGQPSSPIDLERFELADNAARFELDGRKCYCWTDAVSYRVVESVHVLIGVSNRDEFSRIRSISVACDTIGGKRTNHNIVLTDHALAGVKSVKGRSVLRIESCFGPDDLHERMPKVGAHVITVTVVDVNGRANKFDLAPIEIVWSRRR
jgi:hypothetical protein